MNPISGREDCACAERTHVVAALPPISVMKSRRLMRLPQTLGDSLPHRTVAIVHRGKSRRSMSALGQKRTLWLVERMSALPPKADID